MSSAARVFNLGVVLALGAGLAGCEKQPQDAGSQGRSRGLESARTEVRGSAPPANPAGKPQEAPAPAESPPATESKSAPPAQAGPVHESLTFKFDDAEALHLAQSEADPLVSHWQVPEPVSPAPKFSFGVTSPQALGEIKTITLKFYPKWKGKYVSKAAPIVVSADPENAAIQMKPGAEYNLGALGEHFKVLDARGTPAPRLALRPGFVYKLEVVFEAPQPHTAEIVIQTRP